MRVSASGQWRLHLGDAETSRAAGLYPEALALHKRTIELACKLGRPYDEKLAQEASQALAKR